LTKMSRRRAIGGFLFGKGKKGSSVGLRSLGRAKGDMLSLECKVQVLFVQGLDLGI